MPASRAPLPSQETSQFDPRSTLLLAQAELGMTADEFKRTKIGLYLLGVAEQDAREALDGLRSVKPTDTEAIIELQNKAALAQRFSDWLDEAINIGRAAEQQIHEQEQPD